MLNQTPTRIRRWYARSIAYRLYIHSCIIVSCILLCCYTSLNKSLRTPLLVQRPLVYKMYIYIYEYRTKLGMTKVVLRGSWGCHCCKTDRGPPWNETIPSGRFVQGAATAKPIGAHPTLGCPFAMYQILSGIHIYTYVYFLYCAHGRHATCGYSQICSFLFGEWDCWS